MHALLRPFKSLPVGSEGHTHKWHFKYQWHVCLGEGRGREGVWAYRSSGSEPRKPHPALFSRCVCRSLAPLPLLEDGKDAGGLLSAALRTDPIPPCWGQGAAPSSQVHLQRETRSDPPSDGPPGWVTGGWGALPQKQADVVQGGPPMGAGPTLSAHFGCAGGEGISLAGSRPELRMWLYVGFQVKWKPLLLQNFPFNLKLLTSPVSKGVGFHLKRFWLDLPGQGCCENVFLGLSADLCWWCFPTWHLGKKSRFVEGGSWHKREMESGD